MLGADLGAPSGADFERRPAEALTEECAARHRLGAPVACATSDEGKAGGKGKSRGGRRSTRGSRRAPAVLTPAPAAPAAPLVMLPPGGYPAPGGYPGHGGYAAFGGYNPFARGFWG